MKNSTQTYDYISVLAGGSCKFNCSFCVGNDIRNNVTPHYSSKYENFIKKYSLKTKLLSISGDTSDPTFIKETWDIPLLAKELNKDIRVVLHSRDISIALKALEANYDSFVLSIDESFFSIDKKHFNELKTLSNMNKLRFSIVITELNKNRINKDFILKLTSLFPDAKITLRLNVFDSNLCENILNLDELGSWINLSNGAKALTTNDKVWLWDYRETNKKIKALYLFSDGTVKENCGWDKIIDV